MKKYEKTCWFCHNKDMEETGTFWVCRSCGATWNEPPKLGAQIVAEVEEVPGQSAEHGTLTRYTPSGFTIRRIAKARKSLIPIAPTIE